MKFIFFLIFLLRDKIFKGDSTLWNSHICSSSVLSSQHKYILFTLPNYENGTTKTKKDIIYSVSRNHCGKKQFKCMENSSMIRLMTRSSCIRSLCEWQIHTSLLTQTFRDSLSKKRDAITKWRTAHFTVFLTSLLENCMLDFIAINMYITVYKGARGPSRGWRPKARDSLYMQMTWWNRYSPLKLEIKQIYG